MLRTLAILSLALAAGAAGWAFGRREPTADPFTQKRLAFLETENARLVAVLAGKSQLETSAREAAARKEIEASIARLRGLDFNRPVTYREIGREKLPSILRQKLLQQVPEQEFADTGVALAALGLLPPGLDLEKTYLALLGEQIGAFYDQHTRELFTFSGHPLSNAQNRVIMAHELTHALQDQHFDLARLPLETKGNDDRSLAASALIEGDATLAMNQYMLGDLSAASIKDSLSGALTTDVRELVAAPRYLRETLLFPYLHGLAFCQTLYDGGGWSALAGAYARPPASTAQILHPDEYLNREEPIAVELSDAPILGAKPLVQNVLGEFGARQLFAAWLHNDAQAESAAAGWRGDRYLVYGNARANSCVWRTVCRDEPAALAFAEAARSSLGRRYGAKAGSRSWKVIAQDGFVVTVVDAQDAAWSAALCQQFAP